METQTIRLELSMPPELLERLEALERRLDQLEHPAETEMEDKLLNLKEAASYVGLSTFTLAQMARDGELPSYKVKRARNFDRKDLDTWMRSDRRKSLKEVRAEIDTRKLLKTLKTTKS